MQTPQYKEEMMSPKYVIIKNGKNRMINVKQFIQDEKFSIHIRNLVEGAMIVTEDKMSFTDLVMEYSAFLQTTKEGERVLPI
jgi:predicted metallo-beta-lactamase superfamily hydrolase